MFISETLKEYK